MEDIQAAAKAAYIHDDIMAMSDGYDTQIGERGLRLSGWQKQRVAIARAILRRSPIIILDEATASVDVETERQIQNAIADITGKCTGSGESGPVRAGRPWRCLPRSCGRGQKEGRVRSAAEGWPWL